MRVTCDEENWTLDINGPVLMDFIDRGLAAGDAGLYAAVYEAAGLKVVFDNFIVRRP
jgi:hypothetical protein